MKKVIGQSEKCLGLEKWLVSLFMEAIVSALGILSGFAAAMDLELRENRDDLTYIKEYNLNTKPLEGDLLVIKKNSRVEIANEIGKIFRKHNIVKFKSPEEKELDGESDIWQPKQTADEGFA